MKNGEFLYKQLKLGEINKSQLTEQQKGDLYKYMVDSKKVTVDMIKPEVAQKYSLSTTPTYIPSRSKDTNVPLYNQTIPSRSPDTNAPITPTFTPTPRGNIVPDIGVNYNKSTNPELELVDVLSNLSSPRSKAQPYVRQPMNDDITLLDRIKSGVSSIGKTTLGSGMSALGTNVERFSNPWELIPDYQKDIQKFTTENTGIKPIIDYNKELEQSRQKRSEQLQKAQELGIPNTLDLIQQSDKLLQSAAEDNQRGKQGLGKGGQIAYDILQGAGQMGADIGIGMATGTGLLPVIGVRSMGSGASEARQAGADINDQVAYGTLSAGIELATEKIVGGLPFAEKLGASGIADNTIKKLASGIARSPRLVKALTYIGNMAGEGAEEMISEILSPVAQRLTYDPNADWATIEEVLYSGLMGAGVSGIMGGGVFLQGNPIVETLDTELNTIYQAIDNGTPATEQDLNKTIEVLQNLEQQYPDLKEYLQGHMNKIDKYKEKIVEDFKQPQANEINEVEQSIEQDTNVAQIGDNDVTEDINEIVDDNKIDNIIPIEELRQKEIEQPTAEDYLKDMEQDMQIQEEYPIGTKIQARNGNTFEVISKDGDLFTIKNTQTNQEQSYTEGGLKRLGNILQESNNIITETKQIDSVTNISNIQPKTTPKFSQKLYQGKGRTQEEIYLSSAKYPVLGEGQYYAFNKNDAFNYGDDITESNIDLNNPLEIFDDMQWRELTQEAGWEFPNPFAHDEESAKVAIANIKKLKQIVIDKGYDGIIIQFDKTRSGDTSTVTGNSIRTLDKVFGHDQVVSYTKDLQGTQPKAIMEKGVTEKETLVSLANKFSEAMQKNDSQEQIENEFRIDYVDQLEDKIIDYIENNNITEQEKKDFVAELRNQLGDTDAENELFDLGLQDYWTIDETVHPTEQPTTQEVIQSEQIVEEDTNIAQIEDKDAQEDLKTDVAKETTINPKKDKFNNETKPIEIIVPSDRVDKQKIDKISKNKWVNLDRNNTERANAFDKFVNYWYTLGYNNKRQIDFEPLQLGKYNTEFPAFLEQQIYDIGKNRANKDAEKAALKKAKEETAESTVELPKSETKSSKGNIKPIVDYLKNKLDNNEKMQPSELYSLANNYYGGLQTSGAYKTKDAYELLETALNKYIIDNVNLNSSTSKEKVLTMLDKMDNMLSLIPTQTKRSDEQIAKQQFSTPPNISLIAGWTARIKSSDHVLEPSAGNGGLALWGITAKAEVTVNEIDKQRMNNLKELDFDNYFTENAEQLDRILPDSIKPTVVIMNPPFSTSLNMDTTNSSNVKKHIGQALDRLQENGRAVIIAGNTLAEGKPKFSGWWKEIKGKYNVRANITIDGENYRKYGTTFDIQMIVIDKNGATQGETLTGNYKNLEDVINALEGVRNERPEIRNNQSVSRSESTTNKPSDTQNGTEVQSTVGTSTRNDSSSTSSNGSIGDRGGLVESTGKRDNERNNADGVDRGTIQQTTNTELSESSSRSDIERGTTENTTSGNTENEIIGTNEQLSSEQHGSNIDRVEDVVKVKNKKSEKVNTDLDENRVFETYRPEKLDLQNAKPHPAELVESAAMSAVSPPDITYSPAIPNDIIKKGLLSDAQMEAVVYAGQAHSQKLPNGTTKGYYIGDGTGVGKGREIAGIIFDNYMQGRKKAVWVTMNTDLIKDAKRDIEGIGWKDGNVISNLKKGEKIKSKEGVLVTTYGTISSSFSKEVVNGADGYKLSEGNRIQQMYEWLGKDFDGVIAFDEAHKMKSGLSVKKSRGKSKPSDTALAGIALQELFPKAKIVYVSATNAVNVEDLAYGQRLGLWGEGTAFPTVEAFVSEISKGGVAAMELVSRDMKSMGLYTARSISFNGVEYDRLEHKLSKEQVAIYDKIADAWQIILKNVNAAIDATQAQGKHRGAAYSAFWSSNQRFFNQILTSMQMPSALEDMKKQIADGKSIVLQIVSTNEASLERKISSAIEEGLSPDEMDLTPRELLVSYLEKSFPVQQFEIVVDDNGNEHSVPVTDSQGNPVLNREAVKMRDDMIADIQDMPIPDDVLTMLFNEFGSDQVAEITGRKRRVVNKVNEKTGVLERVIEKISSKAGEAEEAAFMNGDKRVLIFSKAGGTGRSYHASKDVKNQQQRVHYLIEAGYSAMDAVQGFGRTHRSNESSAPIYKLVSTDLSGQKRFLSTIARRLGQLGAMTKGQRQASGGMFSEKDNLEGPLASDSLYNLYKDISNGLVKGLNPKETFEILGLNGMLDEYGNLNEKSDDLRNIPKFLNRILSLPVKLQNDIFSQFEIRLDMAMDYAMQNGSLDVGLEVLKGESVDIESKQLLRENKDLNTKTELVKLKVGEKVKKTKFKELSKDRLIGYYQNDRSGSVRAVYSMGMTTKTNGSIVERIRMVGQAQHQNAIQDIDTIQRSNWNEISESEANTLWNDAYNEVSDIKYNTVNMVTGTLLPIWDKLPSDKTRVMRTVTSDGEQLLGRILNERQLEIFMQRMGMNIDREKYTNKILFDEVYKNGKTAHIDNGWKIKSSRVNNEKRLEITGDDFYFYKDRFEKLGLFREYVNSKSRWFIPVNSDTVNILNELLKYNEIIKIADESSGTQAFKGIRGFKGKGNTTIDMSRPLKKPSEIKSFINKTFKVPMTSKKFRKRKAIGFYNTFSEVIRTKYENDIGTVMHELGHHLDKKYNFSRINPKLIQDMIDKLDDDFRNAYKEHELPGEVVAEFLHYYTTDIQTARDFAGDFFELFEETLSKEDLKNIQIVRSDVLRWVNAERSEKRQSTIVPLSQKKKLSERISEVINFEKYNMILFDKYAPLQRFVNTVEKLTGRKVVESLNPHVLVERTYKNDAVIEGIIRGQLRDTKGENIQTNDNLQKIVNEVGKDMAAFEDYLKLKHAITLENKGHQIYSRDIYNSVQEMEQDLATIEQEHPKFIEQSERLYAWYDKFFKAWVVDTNMLGKDSKKAYQTMREEYPYYVPMFRAREDNSTKRAKSSLTDQKSPIDRLSEKGNDQDTISPIDNIITQVSRMVNAYSKNNVMRAIVENYNTVDGLGGFIDRVSPDMEKQIISTQSIKDMIDYGFKTNDNAELIDNIINSIPDLVENYKTLTVSKDQEIVGVIAEDGSRQFYQVFDKAFLDSLTNMNPTQLDATVKLIASIRRTTTALTTGLNPIFSIASNAPRDFVQAYVLGSYKNPIEYVYQYAKAIVNVATKTGNYKKFKEIGGVYGSSMTSELRNKNDFIRHLDKYRKGKKIIPKNALHYIGEFILDINDAIETAPRLAEFNKAYKIAKKEGKSEYDALLQALSRADDVTLNFSRKGTIMDTYVGQSIFYLNAGLQGIDRLRRGLFTGEERTQTFIKALTMLTIPTILLWLAHRDDEDYERLSKGIKDNYWILWKRDDGSFFRIPKPKDLAAIFSSDFERALNAYFKDEGVGAFEGFQSTMADSLLPPTSLIFSPLIDVAKNEKWSGSKIVGMSMEFLPKTEQYDDTTSRIGVILAQAIGKILPESNFASPKNVDYLLDQYYGGLADILLPLTTPNSYTTAEFIKRKFSADPSFSNDVVNDFYDLRDKTMKANKAYNDRGVLSNDVDLIAGEQFKAYYKTISAKWKDINYIGSLESKSLTKEEKQAYTELINQSRYADSTKQKVRDNLSDGVLNKESITMLQKTIRDDIAKTAEKAVKEYKATHKYNNEKIKQE